MVVIQRGNMVVMQGWNMLLVQGGNIVVAWLHHCGMEVHTLHPFLLPVIAMFI